MNEETFEAFSLGDRFASAVMGTTINPDQKPRLVYSVNQMIRVLILRELHLPFEAEQEALKIVGSVINELGDDAPVFVTDINSKPTPKPSDVEEA